MVTGIGAKDGVQAPGISLPDDWNSCSLGAEVNLLTGFPFPSSGYTGSGVRLVRGSNVKRGEMDWSADITEYWPAITSDIARFSLEAGDLVVAMDGALVGRSYAIVTERDLPSLLLQRVARIRSRTVAQSLLPHFIGSAGFVRYVDSVKTHTAIPHISPADIRRFPIAYPRDPAEQHAIAGALEDVGASIEILDRLIAKKRAMKLGAMQQLLTGETRLSGFTSDWRPTPFEEVALPRRTRVNPARLEEPMFCVELEQIESGTGRLLGASETTQESSLKSVFEPGDVLFGKLRSYLRKFWFADRAGVCSTEIWVLVAQTARATPEYLRHLVSTDSFLDAASMAYGTHMPRSDWNVVRRYEVELPPREEQAAIAAILSDMDAEIAALMAKRDKMRAIKQGMMQSLLTGHLRLKKEKASA